MVEPPHRQADRVGQPSSLHPEQLVDGATGARHLVELGCVFGVVEEENVDPVQRQRPEALFERSPGPIGVESSGLGFAIELGRDHEPVGYTAHFGDDLADPSLAAAEPVVAGAVDDIRRAGEDGPYRCVRPVLVHLVAVGVGHAAQGRGSERQGRGGDAGVTDHPVRRHDPSSASADRH
jgi:hypothetical protein